MVHKLTKCEDWFLKMHRRDPLLGGDFKEGDRVCVCSRCRCVQMAETWEFGGGSCVQCGGKISEDHFSREFIERNYHRKAIRRGTKGFQALETDPAYRKPVIRRKTEAFAALPQKLPGESMINGQNIRRLRSLYRTAAVIIAMLAGTGLWFGDQLIKGGIFHMEKTELVLEIVQMMNLTARAFVFLSLIVTVMAIIAALSRRGGEVVGSLKSLMKECIVIGGVFWAAAGLILLKGGIV